MFDDVLALGIIISNVDQLSPPQRFIAVAFII